MKKLDIKQVLTEGVGIGIKNFASLLGATVLYVLTLWIPYINVGTTIAMQSIPVELSKGGVISPLFIFDSKYRHRMGEFFILVGLEAMALVPACFMGILPAIILSYAWSIAILLFIDKDVTALDALRLSNKLTNGNKMRIFLISLCIGVAVCILNGIITGIFGKLLDLPSVAALLNFIIVILVVPITLGCDAVIYNKLTQPEVEDVPEAEADKEEPTVEAEVVEEA